LPAIRLYDTGQSIFNRRRIPAPLKAPDVITSPYCSF